MGNIYVIPPPVYDEISRYVYDSMKNSYDYRGEKLTLYLSCVTQTSRPNTYFIFEIPRKHEPILNHIENLIKDRCLHIQDKYELSDFIVVTKDSNSSWSNQFYYLELIQLYPQFVVENNLIIDAGCICYSYQDGKFLILATIQKGIYRFVGGRVEFGKDQDFEDTARRELHEETYSIYEDENVQFCQSIIHQYDKDPIENTNIYRSVIEFTCELPYREVSEFDERKSSFSGYKEVDSFEWIMLNNIPWMNFSSNSISCYKKLKNYLETLESDYITTES